MSLLKTLKGAIFEEEIVAEKPTQAPAPKIAPVPTSSQTFTPSISPKRMRQTLLDELAKSIAGTPYHHYQKINASMKQKIADTATRCMAIGASLEATNISKQDVLKGAKDAVAFLNSEAASFEAEVVNSIGLLDQQFTAKTEAIAQALEQKQNQIKTLSEEISALQKDKSTLEVEVAAEKTKYEVSKIEFTGSLDSILQEINADINDISIHLGV
jgi:multidrug efflux pump subunit AcrA (membrane-fusion protein)